MVGIRLQKAIILATPHLCKLKAGGVKYIRDLSRVSLTEWKIPPVWNDIERNRARAYAIAYNAMVNMEN